METPTDGGNFSFTAVRLFGRSRFRGLVPVSIVQLRRSGWAMSSQHSYGMSYARLSRLRLIALNGVSSSQGVSREIPLVSWLGSVSAPSFLRFSLMLVSLISRAGGWRIMSPQRDVASARRAGSAAQSGAADDHRGREC